MVGSALTALAIAAAAPATATGTRGCEERAEPPAPDAARVTAPVRFFLAAGDARLRVPRPRGGRYPRVKLALDVRAGPPVTLRVAPESRHRVALYYVLPDGSRPTFLPLTEGQRTVVFTPCPADTPRFSGPGTVGPRTPFPGSVVVTGPQCAHFVVDGARRRLKVPVGRRC